MEKKAGQTLLDEPVRFKVKTGWLFPKKIRLSIKPLYLGTLVKISMLQKDMKIDRERYQKEPIAESFNIAGENSRNMAKIVAYGILNGPVKIALFGRILTTFLYWKLDTEALKQLLGIIIDSIGVMDFMSSIVSLHGVNVLSPRETSQNITGETIASGEELVD